jgi:hypothetical protein
MALMESRSGKRNRASERAPYGSGREGNDDGGESGRKINITGYGMTCQE